MGSGRARGSSRRVKERAVRYGTEHKQATRRRIIETAGRRLKRDGIDGSGGATLMADAGLTNGAFYAHFASKDDLVATTVADQLREQRESLSAVAPGRAGVEQYVRPVGMSGRMPVEYLQQCGGVAHIRGSATVIADRMHD